MMMKSRGRTIVHPGVYLNAMVERGTVSVTDISKRTGLTRSNIYNILKGKQRITPKTAVALHLMNMFQIDGQELLLKQMEYDAVEAMKEFEKLFQAHLAEQRKQEKQEQE